MKLIPFLDVQGRTHDAMAFYARALGGEVASEMKYRDMPPMEMEGPEGCGEMTPESLDLVAHSALIAGDAVLMASDGPGSTSTSGAGTPGPTTVNVEVDSIEEAERVFAALAEGGQVVMPLAETFWAHRWGALTDRFGLPWMVNCMKEPCLDGPEAGS